MALAPYGYVARLRICSYAATTITTREEFRRGFKPLHSTANKVRQKKSWVDSGSGSLPSE